MGDGLTSQKEATDDQHQGGWRWALGRATGRSHVASGQPCQDTVRARLMDSDRGPVLVAIVSDGAGSAPLSHRGSRAVVAGMLREAERHFAAGGALPCEVQLLEWLLAIRSDIDALAAAAGTRTRDFAATLVAALVGTHGAVIAHVGDGAVVVDDGKDGWEVASWPVGGEYASTTYFVTDPTGPRLAFTRIDRPVAGIAVFTDGIEHLVLQNDARCPYRPWFDRMFATMRDRGVEGCDRGLSASLRRYLRGESVDARTHDDRALVLAVRL